MERNINTALLGLKVARRLVETPVDVNFIHDTAGVPDDLSYDEYLDLWAAMDAFLKGIVNGIDNAVQLLEAEG